MCLQEEIYQKWRWFYTNTACDAFYKIQIWSSLSIIMRKNNVHDDADFGDDDAGVSLPYALCGENLCETNDI